MSRYEELQALLTEAEADFGKFYSDDNKAAGTRVRKIMQEVKQAAQDLRVGVLEFRQD